MRGISYVLLSGLLGMGFARPVATEPASARSLSLETILQDDHRPSPPVIPDSPMVGPPPPLPESRGTYTDGHLQYGLAIAVADYLDVRSGHKYGTSELVNALNETAQERFLLYSVPTTIHDLSRKNGGRLPPHKSHQNGLDVDVSYAAFDGKTVRTGVSLRGAYDNAHTWELNWHFIRGIQLSTPVKSIFIDQSYIPKLKKHVLSTSGIGEWNAYSRVLYHEPGHTTHFHVRLEKSVQPVLQAAMPVTKG